MSGAATFAVALLVLLSPCLWMPLGLRLVAPHTDGERHLRGLMAHLHFPAAACLCVAFAIPHGVAAALLALPWLLSTTLLALSGILRARPRRGLDVATFGEGALLVYPGVGAAWALAWSGGIAPLDFSPAIVLLTAAHFHHAGFVLPLAAVHVLRTAPGQLARTATLGVVAGMPLVATGITTTRLGGPRWIELLAALLTVVFALLLALLLLARTFAAERPLRERVALGVAGGALVASMTLAAAYAARDVLGITRFDGSLDLMVWSHGALNGVLLAGGVLVGARTGRPRAASGASAGPAR